MAEQRGENSVLFSLKELRRLEEERVEKEQSEARARIEAERRTREEAERRAREDVERRAREEQDRLRRAEEDRARVDREEQMRLQEAERRARIEGEMRLQEERLRLEMSAKKEQKSVVGPVVGVAVVLLAIGGGLGYKFYQDSQAEKAVMRAKAEEDRQRVERQLQEAEKRYAARMTSLQEDLNKASSDAEKSRVRELMQREQERAQQVRKSARTPSRDNERKPDQPAVPRLKEKRQDIDDDPLNGIK